MRKLEYQVTFNTPAFLGNADQQAQWRTPPFKALLRQWWRVVHAPKVGFDVDELRRAREQAVWRGGGWGRFAADRLIRLRLSAVGQSGGLERWERDDRLPQLRHRPTRRRSKNLGPSFTLAMVRLRSAIRGGVISKAARSAIPN